MRIGLNNDYDDCLPTRIFKDEDNIVIIFSKNKYRWFGGSEKDRFGYPKYFNSLEFHKQMSLINRMFKQIGL
jgi:hypothetical protein